jgi:hypothetical protein
MSQLRFLVAVLACLASAVPTVLKAAEEKCNPATLHEEPSFNLAKISSKWRLIVAPAPGQCNQLILSFQHKNGTPDGHVFTATAANIEQFSFAPNCVGVTGMGKGTSLTGKVVETACYINPNSSHPLFRIHQLILLEPAAPYLAGYMLWDDDEYNGRYQLKGIGSDSMQSSVGVWLIAEPGK